MKPHLQIQQANGLGHTKSVKGVYIIKKQQLKHKILSSSATFLHLHCYCDGRYSEVVPYI